MKYINSSLRRLLGTGLVLGAGLWSSQQANAQILVKVDTTKTWQGYMNVFNLPDYSGGYAFGSSWGAADLSAFFTGTSTLTLLPNTNTYNLADAFWTNPDGTGNKFMEANFYVENIGLRGNTVNFTGTVLSNSLDSAHVTQAFIKVLDSNAGYSLVPGAYEFVTLTNSSSSYTFDITVTIPAGAQFIPQYGFVTTGPNVNPATAETNGFVRIAVDNSDPAITGQPTGKRVQVGGTTTLTVTATGGSPLSYQWKRFGTNLINGGNISGATSATLTISNAQLSDSTTYEVAVTDLAGTITSDAVALRVKTAAEFSNALDNPGFEDDILNPITGIPTPWSTFAGAGLKSTNDNYAFTPGFPVQTIDGTNSGVAYNGGEWNGTFQDIAAAPGDVFTANAHFYVSNLEQIFGDLSGWLEVQFRTAGGNPISLYKSAPVDATSPMDTWLDLQATNGWAGDFVTPIPNATSLVAPEGTAIVRYQVTVHALGGSSGSIYYDGMQLMKSIPITPITITATRNAGNIVISWPSTAGTSYQVEYKDNIANPSWTMTGDVIAGDGTVKSASFPIGTGNRFYKVRIQ